LFPIGKHGIPLESLVSNKSIYATRDLLNNSKQRNFRIFSDDQREDI